jgi:hypothetical protein
MIQNLIQLIRFRLLQKKIIFEIEFEDYYFRLCMYTFNRLIIILMQKRISINDYIFNYCLLLFII